jgi:hypothetical protein
MLIHLPECYRDKHSTTTNYSYSPAANDVWSLGVLFLDLVCGDRIWDVPCDTDARYREFNADPSSFLRAEYPLNDRTLRFLLRILSPESHRISLEALREEISSIDDFYLSDCEIATASAKSQQNAMRYGPWTKLVDGLDDDGEDSFTDSDNHLSTGEFVDINLTTPVNEPLDPYSRGLKAGKQLASYVSGLNLSSR